MTSFSSSGRALLEFDISVVVNKARMQMLLLTDEVGQDAIFFFSSWGSSVGLSLFLVRATLHFDIELVPIGNSY